jgi:hypothetical protein
LAKNGAQRVGVFPLSGLAFVVFRVRFRIALETEYGIPYLRFVF